MEGKTANDPGDSFNLRHMLRAIIIFQLMDVYVGLKKMTRIIPGDERKQTPD